jgi:uncharacterized protein with PIN domain
MPRCELCGKVIVGKSYLIGIKEIPDANDSRINVVLKGLSPKKYYWKPACQTCVDSVFDDIEAKKQ